MTELWKNISDYEGIYEISDCGKVRRISTGGSAVVGRVLKHDLTRGYPSVVLSWNGITHRRPVHLLVLESFVGPRPLGLEACHNDGDKMNPALKNLRWDTHSANGFDCVKHGTHVDNRGSRQGRSKLTEVDVMDIKLLLSEGNLFQREICLLFGVSRETISGIKTGKSWQHLI